MLEDWVFGEPTTKGYDGAVAEGKRTDEAIKYCKLCDSCWEKDKYQKVYNHYKDFPTYGKKREICPRCK